MQHSGDSSALDPAEVRRPAPSSWRVAGDRALEWARARDLAYTLPFIALVLGLVFAPVAAHGGWPMNHEGLTWKYRLSIYAAHFRRFDLLPIWSESAALGLGAPSPVLYHKLFYFVAALSYLLTGSMKAACLAGLGAFSVFGLLGLRSFLSGLGIPRRAALVAGSALLFCNYAYTDWLVRGAFAEYSAMMLLPWLFHWLLGVLEGEPPRRSFRQGVVIFPALYLAHSGLFFFATVPVVAAVAWRLATGSDRKRFAQALLGIGGVFALVALPILVCQWVVTRELSFAEGIAIYAPRDHFASLERHLSGGQYVWGNTWEGLSVQLDPPLVAIALVTLVFVLRAELRRRKGTEPRLVALAGQRRIGYVACWLSAIYFLFLLSPVSGPLYTELPGFWTLQFPWRLLSFVSVLCVALAAFSLRALLPPGLNDTRTACAWLLLAVTYASSPWLHPIRYGWFSASELEAPLPASARLQVGGFEYHPRVEGIPGPRLVEHLNRLSPSPDSPAWSATGYTVERVDAPQFEKGERTYRVVAHPASTVVLPIAYSPFIRVDGLSGGNKHRLPTYRRPEDPRIHVDVPAGELDIQVRFPTLASWCADLLSGAPGARSATSGH